MTTRRWVVSSVRAFTAAAVVSLCSCDGGGGGGGAGSSNHDFGSNDPNVCVAMGDSITLGANQPYPSWPPRLASMIGKTVINAASVGEMASTAAARTGGVLARWKPGYLLIMHGINEMRAGNAAAGVEGVRSMVQQAKANQTIPIVATYYLMTGESANLNPGIQDLDRQLKAMASEEDVTLVNLESAFGSDESLLYMPEGFHPSDAGTQIIAQEFANRL